MKKTPAARHALCASASALAMASASTSTCAAAMPHIIPRPLRLATSGGAFTLTPRTILVARSAGEVAEARSFAASVAPALGFSPRVDSEAGRAPSIAFVLDARSSASSEGYRLSVAPARVTISAPQRAGLFYGAQTLRQLLPPQVLAATAQRGIAWAVPSVTIEDAPRFAWRGMMMDSGRYVFPLSDIKKMLDTMALHKMNTFHWHLTEDQGWRLEIKKHPRLTEVGSLRSESPRKGARDQGDGTPYGGFYTQAQAREVVAYAAERHITVVPEIEMPGHASAAIAAYPSLGNSDIPNYAPRVVTRWGVQPYTFAPSEETFAFLEDVLREVMDIFPSKIIHIGGDEAPKTQWEESPSARAVMAKKNLRDGHELQSDFVTRIEKFLNANGRRIIGWDEILEGGLAPNATVMSWRGEAGGRQAAEQNHPFVMASNSAYYLDYGQSRAPGEPEVIGGYVPLRRVYDFEPAASIPEGKRHLLLGVQAQMWGEYIADMPRLEYLAYPRACAVAETAWSPASKQYADFRERLQTHMARLQVLGVNAHPLEAEATPIATWKEGQVTAEWAEAKWDITPHITRAAPYEVTFQYTGGAHRLDIAWAEILEGQAPAARDEHVGFTGSATRDNVYKLTLPRFTPGAKYALRARVRADGGSDSNGDISIAAR